MTMPFNIRREECEFLFCLDQTWVFSLFVPVKAMPISIHIRNSISDADISRIVEYLLELFPGSRHRRGTITHVHFLELTSAHKAWLNMVCD